MATGANIIQAPHVQERLSRAYGIKGSALAPELNPSVQPVCVVDILDVEADPNSIGRRGCVGQIQLTQGDGVTTFPIVGLVLPIAQQDDILVRVDRVMFCPLTASSYTVQGFIGTPGALLGTPGVLTSKDFTDPGLQGAPAAIFKQSTAGTAIVANPVFLCRVNGNGHQEIAFPSILRKGPFANVDQAVFFQATTVSSIAVTIWWREEALRR